MEMPSTVLDEVGLTRRGRKGVAKRPVLVGGKSPLDEAQKAQIYRLFREGISTEAIAGQFRRTPKVIGRVLNEVRALRLLESKFDYMPHPSFDDPARHAEILGPMPEGESAAETPRAEKTDGLPPYLADLYDAPLLTREQERHLFRKMNFLRHQAALLRSRLDPSNASAADMDEIERLQGEALAVKNQLIRANLRLVVSIAKKKIGPRNNFFELVSDGNMSLIRAVEKFDFALGNKFSTYATWAIIRNFSRSIPEEEVRNDRFQTGHGELFEGEGDHRSDEHESEAGWRQRQEMLQGFLGRLDERERRIVTNRYGLGGAAEMTLEQLGKELGVTKERVRQIEMRAYDKLRKFAAEDELEMAAL